MKNWEDEPFPISHNKLFIMQVKAVLKRRFKTLLHDRKVTVFEKIAPIFVLVLGYFFSRTFITKRSTSFLLSPTYFDSVQQLTINA